MIGKIMKGYDIVQLKKPAIAGTLESSDIQITLMPADKLTIDLQSPVKKRFGKQIEHVIKTTLNEAGIKAAAVKAVDQGALDCVIKARMQSAIYRSADLKQVAWEVLD